MGIIDYFRDEGDMYAGQTFDEARCSRSGVEWDEYFLLMAQLVSVKSRDPSTKVGVVIADAEHEPLSLGFNGFPANMPDLTEYYENKDTKYDRVIHGDMNALLFAGRRLIKFSPQPVTMYLWPFLTCSRCMVHGLQCGIRRFVVDADSEVREYHHTAARYAKECGAKIIPLKRTHRLSVSKIGSPDGMSESALTGSIRTTPLEDMLRTVGL